MKNNDTAQIIKFGKILGVVLILFGLIYLLTEVLVKKDNSNTTDTTSFNEIIVGTALTKKEDKYYVLFYDPTSNIAGYFDSWQTSYIEAKKTIKLYYVDLSKALNKKFMVTKNSNPNAQAVSDLRIKNGTLITVTGGQITSYLENTEEIYKLLK
jgi:hypothetical protein